jgi:hypothetical protein
MLLKLMDKGVVVVESDCEAGAGMQQCTRWPKSQGTKGLPL